RRQSRCGESCRTGIGIARISKAVRLKGTRRSYESYKSHSAGGGRQMNRRFFLKNGGVALARISAAMMSTSILTRAMAQSRGNGRRKILIALFQRGAMDGLSAVIPYADPDYYNLRSSIAVPRPGGQAISLAGAQSGVQSGGQGGQPNQSPAIDLDGFFG